MVQRNLNAMDGVALSEYEEIQSALNRIQSAPNGIPLISTATDAQLKQYATQIQDGSIGISTISGLRQAVDIFNKAGLSPALIPDQPEPIRGTISSATQIMDLARSPLVIRQEQEGQGNVSGPGTGKIGSFIPFIIAGAIALVAAMVIA